jgi:hypothetical protein
MAKIEAICSAVCVERQCWKKPHAMRHKDYYQEIYFGKGGLPFYGHSVWLEHL